MSQPKSYPGGPLAVIIGRNTYYPIASVASILQVPALIAKFIVDANREIAEEEDPNAPKDCLLERQVLALQDPSHRFALDLASLILPFHPECAKDIASDLPGSPDYLLRGDALSRYQIERVKSGIPSVMRSLNPSIPSPSSPDRLLMPKQVGEILGLRPSQVTRLAKAGSLKHELTSGGHRRFRFEDVRDYKINQDRLASDETEVIE
jgi:hypothetical protein